MPDTPPCTRLSVGGLTNDEARSLLRRCSGLDAQATLPPSADVVIKVCVCVGACVYHTPGRTIRTVIWVILLLRAITTFHTLDEIRSTDVIDKNVYWMNYVYVYCKY